MSEPEHPSPGDVCIGCVHKPDPHGAHYFYLPGRTVFVAPDGHTDSPSWILLCEACFVKHAGQIGDDIKAGLIKFGCDMVWPEDFHVNFLRKN